MKIASLFLVSALLTLIASSNVAKAESKDIYVQIGEAKVKQSLLAVALFNATKPKERSVSETIREVILSDMKFSGYFNLLNQAAFLDKAGGEEEGSFNWMSWSAIGTELLIKGKLDVEKSAVKFTLFLYDVNLKKKLLNKIYQTSDSPRDLRALAHKASNDVIERLTGQPGIFDTHLAFICDTTGKKELYVSDYDGANPIRLTKLRSLVVGPSWTPDGNTIFFSVFRRHKGNVKNIDLQSFNIRTGELSLVSNKPGINSGASVSPDGTKIALTMSFLGNSEIFIIDRTTNQATRFTNSWANDVDPTWSPDGQSLAFISDRHGRPMIYMKKVSEPTSDPTRITFAGKYNATPNYSPNGNSIVFASWIDDVFDIFLVNPNDKKLERLTKGQGSNEDPHFSPNGQYIVFSSKRYFNGKHGNRIFITNTEGTLERQVTFNNLGNCTQPRWSRH